MNTDAHTAILAWQLNGSQHAATWLVQAHRPLVLAAMRRWNLPHEMQDDAVQEVFIKVFDALPRYTVQQPFSHWIAVIARHTCSNLQRSWQHRRALSACFENAALDASECELADTRRPDHKLMHDERENHLRQVLQSLPQRELRLLQQSETSGESPRHLTGAQRTALCRARAKIRSLLQSGHFRAA